MTFEQWWSLWEPHFAMRSNMRGGMVMCRKGDLGPYAMGNVYIGTTKQNGVDKSLACKAKKAAAMAC